MDVTKEQGEFAQESALIAPLHEMMVALTNGEDVSRALQGMLECACAQLAVEHGFVVLQGKGGRKAEAGVGHFAMRRRIPRARKAGLCGRAWQRQEPAVIADYSQWQERLPDPAFDIFRAAVAVPLSTGCKVNGIFFFAHTEAGRSFDQPELTQLGRLAGIASFALAQAGLYEQTKNALRAQRKMVRALRASERNNLAAQERLRYMAYHDALTSLPNRLSFFEKLNEALAQTGAERHVAVLMLDLDHFKLINDTLGHDAGDLLIQEVAAALAAETAASQAFLARVGGDEFAVIAPGVQEREATGLAERLVAAVQKIGGKTWTEFEIGLSVGLTCFPRDGATGSELVKNADSAMYCAKAKGRNTWQCYNDSLQVAIQERMRLERELRRALAEGQFFLQYQPQVDIRSGKFIGMEALVRWNHPERGLVSPGQFIPVAEETGLIVGIGQWVMSEACRQNVAWQAAGCEPLRVAVNISARQFHQDWFVGSVQQVLEESGLAPRWLELEITESIAVENAAATQEKLQALRAMGVHISIDDFGTGYSSLIYLKNYPVHTLKIDQTFIRDLTKDESNRAIAQAIIAMGKSLKMEVLAEGVEEQEQQALLATKDCYLMQGYLFGRPMSPEAAAELLMSV